MTQPTHDPVPTQKHPDAPLITAQTRPEEIGVPLLFRKTALTRAIRMPGPFRVETSETENEPFLCEDGYLAWDQRGYPYAIAADEFVRIYEEAKTTRPGAAIGMIEIYPEACTDVDKFSEAFNRAAKDLKLDMARSLGFRDNAQQTPGQMKLEEG